MSWCSLPSPRFHLECPLRCLIQFGCFLPFSWSTLMSVVTILFFLAVPFLFLAACAPNQRADRLPNSPHPYVLSDQSTQSVVLAITAKHDLDAVPSPRTTASGTGSSNAGGDVQIQTTPSLGFLPSNTGEPDLGSAGSLSHKHSTLDSWLKNGTSYTIPNPTQPSQCRRSWPIPAGNIDNGAISGDNCLQTQPSPGSQFSNYTAPFPRSGFGNNGRSGPETGCPPVQTVTMPPSTVTLPAQTITVTASQVTATITVTPQTQTQTQTVTVTVTITAGPAPPYPTITSSPGSGLITAQSNMNPTSQGIPLSSLSATAQGVVPLSAPGTGQNSNSTNNVPGTGQLVPSLNILSTGQGTSQSNVPNTAGVNFPAVSSVPPNGTGISTQAGNTVANQPNPITGVPIASSNSPQYFSIPATLASELDTIPLFQPSPAAIPIPSRSGIRGIGTAYAQSVSGSSSNTLTGQFAAPYQNATSGSGLSVPSGSGPVPGIGPIASVINRPASGPIAPGTISASLYQVIGSFMSPPPVVADPTGASKFYPRPNYTNTAPIVNTDPVSVPSGSPAGPSIYPTPIIIGTSAQAAPSSSLNANTSCSTSTQNITVDVRKPLSLLFL